MKQYLITMILESDTCFGAGESKNGLVNTEILLDEDNFPYFLSKTFMGVWRESIENFILPSLDNQKPEDKKNLAILKSLFSDLDINGDVKACWQSNLSNFTIDKGIADKFNDAKYEKYWKDKFEKEEVSPSIKDLLVKTKHDALLKIEQATRINDNQVAEDKSLRAIRVIKKGMVFNSILTIKGDVQSSDQLFLEKLLKIIKHMGTGKTRGMGRVRLELRDLPASEIKRLNKPSYKNIIRYEFEIQEPVKVSKSEEQYDFEPTHKYIPGGTMRGAFFANWLQKDENKALDYIKKIKYYNAYPVCVEENEENEEKNYYSIPMPNIYRNDKQQGRTFKADKHQWVHKNSSEMDKSYVYETIFDSYVTDTLYKKSNEPNLIYKYNPAPFCYIKDDKIYAFDITTSQRFHHTHKKSNENIYRYEAIEPGYLYYGFLDLSALENENGNKVLEKLIEMPTMWIGGSKKSGYGRVEIKGLESYDSLEAALIEMNIIGDSEKGNDKTDLLYFYSDYAGDLDGIDSLKLSDDDMSLSLGNVTGYNTHWNARTPMIEVIEKGSVIRSNHEQTEQWFRERAYLTEEGFGSIIKNPKIFTLSTIKAFDKKKHDKRVKNKKYYQTSLKYAGDYDIFLKDRMEAFVERKIRSWISLTMEDGSFEKFVKHIKGELKDSFRTAANSLIQLIDSQVNDEKVQNSITQWLADKKQVSLNREQIDLNYKFLDLNIAGYSLEEWLSSGSRVKEKTNLNNFLEFDFDELYTNLKEEFEKLCLNSEIRGAVLNKRKIQTRLICDILYYAIQSYDQMKGER